MTEQREHDKRKEIEGDEKDEKKKGKKKKKGGGEALRVIRATRRRRRRKGRGRGRRGQVPRVINSIYDLFSIRYVPKPSVCIL